MAGSGSHRSEKELRILDCALRLLKDTGDAGLTMRKIAECADMRLSNVQYYFKSRDDVLEAMVARYVEDCSNELKQLTLDNPASSSRARAKILIASGLRHGDQLSDMCRIFRELWALSSRNETVRNALDRYYSMFSALIADFVLGEAADPDVHVRIRALLLPFFEGYSVTASSLPIPTEQVTEMLTDITMSLITDGAGRQIG